MHSYTVPLTIVIGEDHARFRNGFILLLKKHIVVKEAIHAANGIEVLEALHKNTVDLVFLDHQMPLMDGVECMHIIRKEFPKVKVIVVSMCNAAADIKKMIKAGAHGYMVKALDGDDLGEAVKTVMAGKRYYDRYVLQVLLDEKIKPSDLKEDEHPADLTGREIEVLIGVTQGKKSKEIGGELHIEKETVDVYRKSILKKTGSTGIADSIRFALRNGIVSIKEFLGKE